MRVTSSWLTEGAESVHQRPAPPAAGIHATTPPGACAQYPRRDGFDHVCAMATTLETDGSKPRPGAT